MFILGDECLCVGIFRIFIFFTLFGESGICVCQILWSLGAWILEIAFERNCWPYQLTSESKFMNALVSANTTIPAVMLNKNN